MNLNNITKTVIYNNRKFDVKFIINNHALHYDIIINNATPQGSISILESDRLDIVKMKIRDAIKSYLDKEDMMKLIETYNNETKKTFDDWDGQLES